MQPDQGLHYELAAVLGQRRTLLRLARVVHSEQGPESASDLPGTGRPSRIVDLDVAGLALLPVTAGLAEAATAAALCALGFDKLHGGSQVAASRRRDLLTGAESGFEVLTPGLVALIEAASILSDVAYVEADYLGRDGRQAAAVWRSGRVEIGPLLLGPTEPFKPAAAPISVALQALGVRGRPENAFLVVGLGQCRRTVDWARLAAEVDEYGDGDGDAR